MQRCNRRCVHYRLADISLRVVQNDDAAFFAALVQGGAPLGEESFDALPIHSWQNEKETLARLRLDGSIQAHSLVAVVHDPRRMAAARTSRARLSLPFADTDTHSGRAMDTSTRRILSLILSFRCCGIQTHRPPCSRRSPAISVRFRANANASGVCPLGVLPFTFVPCSRSSATSSRLPFSIAR